MNTYQLTAERSLVHRVAKVAIVSLILSLLSILAPSSLQLMNPARAEGDACASGNTDFPSGSGRSGDPFLISHPDSLIALSQNSSYWNCHFKLDADIDMSGTANFSPIGLGSEGSGGNLPFTGSFNGLNAISGENFTISNLTIETTNTLSGIGMFGYVDSASITNLTIESITVHAENAVTGVGALAGIMVTNLAGDENVSISNIHIDSATIHSDRDSVGGLIGYPYGRLDISNCSVSNSKITGRGSVGGLVGDQDNFSDASITSCQVRNIQVTMAEPDEIRYGFGGFAGIYMGTMSNLVADSFTVNATESSEGVGGVVGILDEGALYNVTVESAEIRGYQLVGGVVGRLGGEMDSVSVRSSHIFGVNSVGGIVGVNTEDFQLSDLSVEEVRITGDASGYGVGGIAGKNVAILETITVQDSIIEGGSEVGGVSGNQNGIIRWARVHDSKLLSTAPDVFYFGGVVGSNGPNGVVQQVALTGASSVEGTFYVGGIAGDNFGLIEDVFVSESVRIMGLSILGGLVGANKYSDGEEGPPSVSVLKNSYSMATLLDRVGLSPLVSTSDTLVGLLVGTSDTPVISSFALRLSNPLELGYRFKDLGDGDAAYVADLEFFQSSRSLADKDLLNLSTFTGWDISDSDQNGSIWIICNSINDGYPALRWMYTDDSCGTGGGPGGGTGDGDSNPPAPAVQPVIPQSSSISSPTQLEVIKGESLIVFGVFSSPITNVALNSSNLPQSQWVQTYGTVLINLDTNRVGGVELQIFNGQVPLLPVVFVTFVDKSATQPPAQETSSVTAVETPSVVNETSVVTQPVTETPVVTTPSVPDTTEEPVVQADKKPVVLRQVAVSFLTSSSTLEISARRSIRNFANSLKGLNISSITVTGFTSDTRSNPNRKALALARARSVGAELVRAGISAEIRYRDGGNQKGVAKGQIARIQVRGLE